MTNRHAEAAGASASPTALVTGASSGIGLELARLLAAGGNDLVLVARSTERLERIASELRDRNSVRVVTRATDLAEPGAAQRLWRDLAERGVAVDILVNNAGVGRHGPFSGMDVDAIDRLVTLNAGALTALTRLALPGMLSRRVGRILNVASLAAYQPGGPLEAVYYATKAYVLSFSKGLARELRGSGVTITVLCPGPTHTSFSATSGASDTPLYRWAPSLPAEAVAEAGYRGLMRGKQVVIPGIITRLLAIAGELPPRGVALEVNRWLLQALARRS